MTRVAEVSGRSTMRSRKRSIDSGGQPAYLMTIASARGRQSMVRPIASTLANSTPGDPLTVTLHRADLPDDLDLGPIVAVDCETMGLNPHRDRLCLVQLSSGDGSAHLVQVHQDQTAAPNLVRLLGDPHVLKLFHFGRFDIAVLLYRFGVTTAPVYCTKIASKLVRTYTDRHGLKNLVNELLGLDISKQQQSSDWGAGVLTEAQQDYAASDVLHLHRLKAELDARLAREKRTDIAQACFEFLPHRAALDLAGWPETDIFSH